MLSRIKEIILDSAIILSKSKYNIKRRIVLLHTYYHIVLKRFFLGRLINPFDTTRQHLFGYTFSINNYSDFYWIFKEIFIEEEYYFSADTKTPYIIDCGGNIGISVLYFKWLYPDSRVLVFEPESVNIKVLKDNIISNNIHGVELIEKGVGGRAEEIVLYGNRILSTIHPELIAEQHKLAMDDKEHKSVINIDLLSKYIVAGDTVDMLKLDIEGAEGEVISDLYSHAQLSDVKKVAMEYHAFDLVKNSISEITKCLVDSGHNIAFKTSTKNAEGVPVSDYYNYMLYSSKSKKK